MLSVRTGCSPSDSFLARFSEDKNGLYYLLGFAFLLKLFLFFRVEVITNDGPTYINQAIQILDGQLWSIVKNNVTVFYSALIAGFSFFIPDMVLAGQAISMAASVLTVIPLFRLIKDITNSRVAFWGCFFFIVLPCFNEYAVEVMRDPLFLLVFTAMILYSWRFLNEGNWRNLIGALVLATIGIFLRIEVLVFIPFFLVFYFVKVFIDRNWRWQVLLMTTGVVGFLVVSSTFFESIEIGGRVIHLNNFWKYSPDIKTSLKTLEASLPGFGNENTFISIVAGNIRLIYVIGILLILIKQVTFVGLIFFIYGLRSESNSFSRKFFAGIAFTYLILAFDFNLRMGFMNERYLFVPVLMTLPWIGFGVDKFLNMATGKRSQVVVSAFLLIFFLVPLGMTIKEHLSPQPLSAKMAGEWMRTRTNFQNTLLIANERKIPFYANRNLNYSLFEFEPFQNLVQMAAQPGEKLISISLRKFNLDEFSGIDGYDLAAKFEDERYASLIYYKKN